MGEVLLKMGHFFGARTLLLFAVLFAMNGWAKDRPFDPNRCPLALLSDFPAKAPNTQSSKIYLLRQHFPPEWPVHEVLVVTTYDSPGDFRTHVIRRDVRAGVAEVSAEELARLKERGITEDKSEKIHFSMIAPVLKENIALYEDRRDWPSRFDKKLWEIGKDYLNDSIYIVVTHKSNGQVAGAMRVIRAPYGIRDGKPVAEGPLVRNLHGPVTEFRSPGKRVGENGMPLPPRTLPEFDYLGIEADRPAVPLKGFENEIPQGLLSEIGMFFNDKKLSHRRKTDQPKVGLSDSERQQVWTETITALSHIAHEWDDPHFSYYGQAFHFYADPESQEVYKPFQYTPLRHYWQDGKEVTVGADEMVPLITKDGVKWMPVVMYLETLDDYYRRFASGQVSGRHDVSPFEVLTRRVAAGTLFDPEVGLVLSAEPELTSMTLVWAATEPKLPLAVNFGATGMLIRQLDLFNLHIAKRMAEGDQTEVGQRAEKTARGMEFEVKAALAALREMRNHPSAKYRLLLARYYNDLLKGAEKNSIFGDPELVRDFIAPALFDQQSPLVREQALWTFRELTPERIRNALAPGDLPSVSKAKAEAALRARGIPIAKISPAVKALAAGLRLAKPATDNADAQAKYWADLKPALESMGGLREYGPEISVHLLTLAAIAAETPSPK